jgi:hypothetical protein
VEARIHTYSIAGKTPDHSTGWNTQIPSYCGPDRKHDNCFQLSSCGVWVCGVWGRNPGQTLHLALQPSSRFKLILMRMVGPKGLQMKTQNVRVKRAANDAATGITQQELIFFLQS